MAGYHPSSSDDETLTGAAGADTFLFGLDDGNDVVTDFSNGEDLIDLTQFPTVSSFSDLTITSDANGVTIDLTAYGGGTILLQGMSIDDLDASDFIFPTVGTSGDDTLTGGSGRNVIYGGEGNDSIEGGGVGDRLLGDEGNDTIYGGDGGDWIDGGIGDDLIYGGDDRSIDWLYGGEGNDTIYGGDGQAAIGGGEGDDVLYAGTGGGRIRGEEGNDTLSGSASYDYLYGGEGDDSLDGGSAGTDSLYGGAGNDTLIAGEGNDTLDGGVGDDSLEGGAGVDSLVGGEGNDTLSGGGDQDFVNSGAGDDYLYGGTGHDHMWGGTGSDTLDGGAGDDHLLGDNSLASNETGYADTFVFQQGHGHDQIGLFKDGVDKIDLTAFTDITSFGDLTITTQDNEVVIDLSAYGGGTIRFEANTVDNIEIGDLDTSDFVFYEASGDPGVEGI